MPKHACLDTHLDLGAMASERAPKRPFPRPADDCDGLGHGERGDGDDPRVASVAGVAMIALFAGARRHRARRASLIALALALVCGGCNPGERQRQKKLTLYCSAQIKLCQTLARNFQAHSGIKVAMVRKSTGEALAQIRAERRSPKADAWWGGTGDGHIQAAKAKLSTSYRSPQLAHVHPWAVDLAQDGENRVSGAYMGALGFGYNRRWLEKARLPPPKGWRDLAKPIYRGEVQMANPNSSGTAYTVLATVVQLFGEDAGFAYLADLHRNVNQYTKSGAAPIRAAARGETGIGIVFLHDAHTQVVAGFPIEVVVPEEGTGYEVGGISLIQGGRHPDSAQKFMDYALSAEAQSRLAEADAFQTPSNTASKTPSGAPSVRADQLIDFDFQTYSAKATRVRLLKRWDNDIKTGAR